jgi:hypothetical protein
MTAANRNLVGTLQSPRRPLIVLILGMLSWSPFAIAACLPNRVLSGAGPGNLGAAMILCCILAFGFVLSGIGVLMAHDRGPSGSIYPNIWRAASFLTHAFLFGPVGIFVLLFLFAAAPPLAFGAIALCLFLAGRALVRRARLALASRGSAPTARYDY